MLELQFILQNIHFVICMLASLVFFSIAWLYFDALLGRRTPRGILKLAGFVLLSFSFVVQSIIVEQTILSNPILGSQTAEFISSFLRIGGYISLFIGLFLDPIQAKPHTTDPIAETAQTPTPAANQMQAVGIVGISTTVFQFLAPLLSFGISLLYFRQATTGLERHLKPVAFGFFGLFLAETLHLATIFRSSTNFVISDIVKSFGAIWIAEHLLIVISVLILGGWVFWYLLKRIQTQLFIIFMSVSLVIFVVVTLTFAGLLFTSLKKDVSENLRTNAMVLNYAIESKKAEALSDAQLVAQNPQVISALATSNKVLLNALTNEIIASKNQSYLMVVAPSGEILAQPDNMEAVGTSISDDPLFKQGKSGRSITTIAREEGVLSPVISIRAITPVTQLNTAIGFIVTGTILDNAFVDGIKKTTELDSSIYAGLDLTATTLIAPDGKTRYIGTSQNEGELIYSIFNSGKTYLGELTVQSSPYIVAVLPLKDVENQSIGMLLIGKEKIKTIQTIGNSIELTFLLSTILLCISVLPIYFVSRYLSNQFK